MNWKTVVEVAIYAALTAILIIHGYFAYVWAGAYSSIENNALFVQMNFNAALTYATIAGVLAVLLLKSRE